ncbi:MAG TPA: S8 family peptidase [Chryseolinea sp.]
MADDNYHLKIPDDNIRNESYPKHGGGQNYPRTDYTSHGKKLYQDTRRTQGIELKRSDYGLVSHLYLQIESPITTTVKIHRVSLEKLGFQLVYYDRRRPHQGVFRIAKQKFEELDKKIDDYINTSSNVGKSYFSAIDAISPVPVTNKTAQIDTSTNNPVAISFNLYNSVTSKEKFVVNRAIVAELKAEGSDITDHDFSNGTTSISCTMSAVAARQVARKFITIRDVTLNRTATTQKFIKSRNLPSSLIVSKPKSNSRICIIDSGVNNSSGIFSSILASSMPYLPSGSTKCQYDHGTFVASRCVFGDDIQGCMQSFVLNPYCQIVDVQTFGIDGVGKMVGPTEFHLRRVIEEVVIKLHKTVRVYNLSLGFGDSIDDYEFSETAKLLDELTKKYKVLFIVASGNIDRLLGIYPNVHFQNPLARIGSPAESLLSITVGAYSKLDGLNTLSRKSELAPFSKIGPGADLGVKPELVAHGGNLVKKYKRLPAVSTYGISSDGKTLAVDVGTSFAAPLVSQYAQRLFDHYPSSDPNLIKALLYHYASSRSIPKGLTKKDLHCTGFGEPDVDQAVMAGPHSASFIFEGKLPQDKYQFVGFHVPKSLAAGNKKSKLRLKITLVYDPQVDNDNRAEYSKARIAISIQKPNNGTVQNVNLSDESNYQIQWNPIIKCSKVFTRNYLPGNWELRLRLFTRGKISKNYMQDYAVIIEVMDANQYADVYNDVLSEYRGVYRKLKVRLAA